MTGRVCVITGATGGIGEVTARELARLGATVVIVARDPSRTAATVSAIRSATGNDRISFFLADLTLQSQVRRVAAEILAVHPQVHVLVNNAGAIVRDRVLTAEGHESTWALNVLTPFLLTHLLTDRLTASAPSRVVNVASAAHLTGRLHLEDVEASRRYSGYGQYSWSKLALLLLTYEWARRLRGTGVTVNALHPGVVKTGFGHDAPGFFDKVVRLSEAIYAMGPEQGALTSIYLASAPDVADVTGQYFDHERPKRSSRASYDTEAQRQLWAIVARQTGVSNDLPSGTSLPPAVAPPAGSARSS
jgi:NAD(P)-dependent dehydrogenase (short-subunit alcohol dehydrogenase family)